MVKFLTDDWIAALDHEAHELSSPITESFVVEYRVQADERVTFAYHIAFDALTITVRSGNAAAPTIVLSTDRATAVGIATNTVSAQSAFMAGQLHLDGDIVALVRNHDALAKLDDIFATVRAATEY